MTLEKILEMLGVDKIDESKQTEVKDALETIIETKASSMVEEKVEASLNEEKEKLVEEFEKKFEDYKEDVTSKFSNFVDSILEEEMVIPEKVVKYARLGELYEDLIDQFKIRLAIDEGLLDEEVKSMLGEAKNEIESLRGEVNELTGNNLQLEKDAKDLATHVYLRKKCDGLTEGQKSSVMNILEGSSKEDIDRKFEVVLESIGAEVNDTEKDTKEVNEMDKKYEDMTDEEKEEYDKKMNKNEETEKQSTTEVSEKVKETMNEGNSIRDQWKKMIREGKF